MGIPSLLVREFLPHPQSFIPCLCKTGFTLVKKTNNSYSTFIQNFSFWNESTVKTSADQECKSTYLPLVLQELLVKSQSAIIVCFSGSIKFIYIDYHILV